MYYTYILISEKDHGLYIGFTSDLEKRIKRHLSGQVTATKNRLPLKLIFYEGFLNKNDAESREKYLKSGYGRKNLYKMLQRTLKRFKFAGIA
ncbi:MAG: GIY-YIG nuclease family protein [Patescibacteria group bacterium]|nr:GIY-YIG nuclease family protein [Patescibacteria group bacterium]